LAQLHTLDQVWQKKKIDLKFQKKKEEEKIDLAKRGDSNAGA
jgi:hypothetical protein